VGEAEFDAWGWRVPFLVSVLLLAVSVWIRLSMNESPAFAKMKAEGKTSKAPLSEAFWPRKNAKIVFLALVGLTDGPGRGLVHRPVLRPVLPDPDAEGRRRHRQHLIAASLVLARRSSSCSAVLSDKIGRKPIILGGCLIAALTYFPIFGALTHYANPALETRTEKFAGGRDRRSWQPATSSST
jgi:MFS family permease